MAKRKSYNPLLSWLGWLFFILIIFIFFVPLPLGLVNQTLWIFMFNDAPAFLGKVLIAFIGFFIGYGIQSIIKIGK